MKTRIRWNRHTLALAAIVGGMWYAAEAQSNGAAHLIALLTAAMGALSWLHARANLRGLGVRIVGARPVAQDVAKQIPVELRANGAVSPCGLEVIVIGAEKPVFVERVPAGGAVAVNLPPPVHTTGGAVTIRVRSVYPLGLFTAESVLQTSWMRRVHPKPAGDLPLPLPDASRHGDAVSVSSSQAQSTGGDDFAGLREWRAGDSPRHIDWRAIARGGPLMVKGWSAGAQGVVVLDWNALRLEDAARASQIARWMEICEGENRPYELRLPGLTIRGGLGPSHHRRCLDALATQMATDEAGMVSSDLKDSQGVSDVSFERSSYLPAKPLLFLSVALLLAIWPLHGYIANSGLWVCALCLLWRGVLRMGVPHVAFRALVMVGGIALVYFDYGELQGMEPGIALLLVLAGTKVLESRTPREFQILGLIGWFLAFCIILLENHLFRSVWVIGMFLLIAACMVRFRRSVPGMREPARVTATLFAQALPVALALFFVFPRGILDLGNPLGRSRFGETGIDDTLDPGSLTGVALSDDVAFRVRFPDGEPPPTANRYWRCLTLWHCDGLRWTKGDALDYRPVFSSKQQPGDVRQWIDLEPHGRKWIPALERPVSASCRGMRLFPEFDQTLVSPVPVRSAERIEVISRFELPQFRELSDKHREAALQLPENVSPRLQRLVETWETVAQNDEQIVNLARNYLRTQGFTYTLEPGEYAGPGGLEDFLLNRRSGFCEHFSAGFGTLMRMAGVPTRLVIGYLGGEFSEHNGGYLIVKQSDVHAWTEVWLERYGWYQIDPTAALAPERLNIDLGAWLAGGAEAAERQRSSLWWRTTQRVRLFWDSLNYAWQDRVIDYNQDTQRDLLGRLGLAQSKLMLLLISGAAVFVATVGISWWLRRPARHSDPWMRAWQRACQRLVKAGVPPRAVSEGPLAFAERVAISRPDLAAQIKPLAELYATGRYGSSVGLFDEFKMLLAKFKPVRPARSR
ncbi:MAG: transglutaminaseTgpA domain-containing protein [Verrucomicrobiaceae bacterium]